MPLDQTDDDFLESELYARHVEVNSAQDLMVQRGTPIPALLNQFYKFIQNPSTVSIDTYKRMIDTDDTIGSGVDFLTTCLQARMGSYQHESEEITAWVNKALDNIDGGWSNSLKELFSAAWAGFSAQEIVWQNGDNGFTPKKLVTLPPSTIMFEVDRTGELTQDGILQYQRNYNPGMGASTGYMFGFSGFGGGPGARQDPYAKLGDFPFPIRTGNLYSYMSVRIPRQKCLHYAFDAQGKFQNPYGRSLLRRAYKYYVMKDAFLQMLAIALDRKGTPLTIVYYNPDLTVIDPNKAGGSNMPIGSARDKDVGIRGGVAAREAFRNIHNDTTIFLPGKKDQHFNIDKLDVTANANDFIGGLDFCNKSIMRSLLLPALVFTSGDGSGSFALGQEHAKTFDKILDSMNAGASQVVIDQLISQMIRYNFPESAWKKDGFGAFGKRQLSPDEIQKEMEVCQKAVDMGAVDMNDLNDLNVIRDKAGFEPRTTPIPQKDPFGMGMAPGGFGDEQDPDQGDPGEQPPGQRKPGPPPPNGQADPALQN